jgi:hypothetical protein
MKITCIIRYQIDPFQDSNGLAVFYRCAGSCGAE